MKSSAPWRSERFESIRLLGAGGFGVVHAARDLERGGVVAVKTLSHLEPRGLLRFKREFRALADLVHVNLVAPFELIEEGGEWLLTMPLVDGEDFSTWVRGRGPRATPHTSIERIRLDAFPETLPQGASLSSQSPLQSEGSLMAQTAEAVQAAQTGSPSLLLHPDRLMAVLPQLVEGVATLHRYGLVHRDLKPTNVLVDAAGVVRILDFGLVADRAQTEDVVLGTPAYMAPEQARGMPVDEAADWYAVGVMVYECLTGVRPFEGSLLQLMVAKQTQVAPRASERVAGVPEELDALCAALLSTAPDARPRGPEILQRLGTPVGGTLTVATRSGEHLLVGRDEELSTMQEALAAAEAGEARVLRLEGASGSGKSTLVAHFVRGVTRASGPSGPHSARVLVGRCYEQERVPYLALDGVIDALVPVLEARGVYPPAPFPELARIFPVLGSVVGPGAHTVAASSQVGRRLAARALREVLSALAVDRPVVICIDDAQWGDSDSGALLAELFAWGPLPRVLWVFAHRSESGLGGDFLSALDSAKAFASADVLSLGPLDDDAAVALALAVLGDDDEAARARARQVAIEAKGHAMFVHELAHHASDSVRPASLDLMIGARVAKLDPPSRALLEVIAVAGSPLPRSVVEAAAGVGETSVATERSLRAGRFVRATGPRGARSLSPYHDRIREVAVGRLSDSARRGRHLAIADALEAFGGAPEADPALLSRHLHEAGVHPRAIPYTLIAAERAAKALAFERAVSHYRRAVECTSTTDPAWVPRMVSLGEALACAARGTEAASTFLAAAELMDPAEGAPLRRRAVEQWIRAGRLDEGLGALDEALRGLGLPTLGSSASAALGLLVESTRLSLRGPPGPTREEGDVDPLVLSRIDILFSVGTALTLVDPLRGIAFTRKAARMALEVREPGRVIRAHTQLAAQAARRGTRTMAASQEHIQKARAVADLHGNPVWTSTVQLGEAFVCFLGGRFRTAAELVYEAEPAIARRSSDYKWELDATLRVALKSHTYTGELGRMRTRAVPLLADAAARGDLFSEVALSNRFMHLVALMDDDAALAQSTIDEAIARWSGRKPFVQHFLDAMARVEVALYRGEGAEAHAALEAQWRTIEKSHVLRGQYTGGEGRHLRARAALAAGNLHLTEKLARWCDDEPAAYLRAFAAGLRAGVLFQQSPQASRGAFTRAAELLAAADLPLFAAAARARAGVLTPGAAGHALIAAAHEAMRAEGIQRPEGFIDVYAPIAPTR